jgi:hypothetical protein
MAVGGYIRRVPRQPSGRRRLTAFALVSLSALVILVFAGSATADSSGVDCADAVLDDWTRGTLGPGYSPECYQEASDALPEDLRAYTTAADDITRAGIAAGRALDGRSADRDARRLADTPATEAELRSFPTEVAVLGGVLAVLLPAGLAAALLRRWRGR